MRQAKSLIKLFFIFLKVNTFASVPFFMVITIYLREC